MRAVGADSVRDASVGAGRHRRMGFAARCGIVNEPPIPPEGYVAVEPGHPHVEVMEPGEYETREVTREDIARSVEAVTKRLAEPSHPDPFDWAQEPDL
jgi:hypothetical protein